MAWERASGRATLHTYVISHRAAPGIEDQVPYAIAVVELEEGPRMMTNIVGIPNTLRRWCWTWTSRSPSSRGASSRAGVRPRGGCRMSVRAAACIVGAAETERIGVVPDLSQLELHADAARRALADAGLTIVDIDGVAAAGQSRRPSRTTSASRPPTSTRPPSAAARTCSTSGTPAAAISAGLCEVVLITHGESGRSRVGAPPRVMDAASPQGQFEAPFGRSARRRCSRSACFGS